MKRKEKAKVRIVRKKKKKKNNNNKSIAMHLVSLLVRAGVAYHECNIAAAVVVGRTSAGERGKEEDVTRTVMLTRIESWLSNSNQSTYKSSQ